ncbi:MAG: hypothetical protein WD030_11320 [Pirellulales bacterium]
MSLKSQRELDITREKLRRLEERYAAYTKQEARHGHASDLSRQSLKRLINQLKEEIARFEAHIIPGAK